jgi:glutamyl-tRNA synthetase
MKTIVRFAPSPTGYLHVGNIRLALINWLYARANNGEFILRFDDTDSNRSKSEYIDAIRNDLNFLNLNWDSEAKQSDNMDKYSVVTDDLKNKGLLYPCYETPEELDFKRKRLRSQNQPPIYDRSSLRLTNEQKSSYEQDGRRPHWRFKLKRTEIVWSDLVRGKVVYNTINQSDPVVIRGDGTYLYLLPSVVDDINHNISHIIRGEDHVTNSAVQLEMMDAIKPGKHINFAHIPLLLGSEGEALSKRLGSLRILDLRESDIEALSICSLLARLGSSDSVEACNNMESIISNFNIKSFSRATPKFSFQELLNINVKVLQKTSFSQISERFKKQGVSDSELHNKGELFWNSIKANINKFNEALTWWDVCFKPLLTLKLSSELLTHAIDSLPQEPWSDETWQVWTTSIKEKSGLKGKKLFLPLRQALTGLDSGPELKYLLPLIGRERTLKRISGDKA